MIPLFLSNYSLKLKTKVWKILQWGDFNQCKIFYLTKVGTTQMTSWKVEKCPDIHERKSVNLYMEKSQYGFKKIYLVLSQVKSLNGTSRRCIYLTRVQYKN